MDNTENFVTKNFKTIVFVVCVILVSFLYNLNNQTINIILKKGVVLEYSLSSQDSIILKKEIEDGLEKTEYKNLKILFADDEEYDEFDKFDVDNKPIMKSLFVGFPLLLNQNNKEIVNKISDIVFKKDNKAKLVDVGVLNEDYHILNTTLFKVCGILFVATFLWLITMYLLYDFKQINQSIVQVVKGFIEKQKTNFNNLIEKTKEQGFKYLIKVILFDEKEDEKTDYTKEIFSTIVFVVVCVIVIRFFIGELRWIPSGSMRPTILEKDRVFVEKLEYPHVDVKRGDILVFYPPEVVLSDSPLAIFSRLSGIFCKDIAFIKRVIGMPGDKFEIKFNKNSQEYRVYINDVPIDEPYISSKISWTNCTKQMYCGPFEIPSDSYFMMGDNRDNSQDSRFWGFLKQERVIGKANFMFWPISRINVLTDKYFELNKEIRNGEILKYNYILNRY